MPVRFGTKRRLIPGQPLETARADLERRRRPSRLLGLHPSGCRLLLRLVSLFLRESKVEAARQRHRHHD